MSDNLHLRNLPIPFLSQRKNTYIWEERYLENTDKTDESGKSLAGQIKPNGEKYSMACNSCNITSVAMVLHYFGITNDTPDRMMERYYENKNDHVILNAKKKELKENEEIPTTESDKISLTVDGLENWYNLLTLVNGLYADKLSSCVYEDSLSLKEIKASIAAGYPVVANNGVLARTDEKGNNVTTGHIVVIRGFTKINEKEYIILNDPWGDPANAEGDLKPGGDVRGFYYESLNATKSNYSGGTGDNCIIELSKFESVIAGGMVSSALVIKAPLWNFPDGSEITNARAVYQKENLKGGGFPIKANSLWHNGIHLQIGGVIQSIGAGRIIAARNAVESPETGDASFVLMRHEFEDTGTKKIQQFYALYMHLKSVDIPPYAQELFTTGRSAKEIKWLYQLFRHMLPLSYIVFNKNSKEKSGFMGSDYQKIPVYKAEYTNGVFYKQADESPLRLGQRILIQPLPANNPELFKKLLDPAKYGDKSFLREMVRVGNYEKMVGAEKYLFFFYKGELVCVESKKEKDGGAFSLQALANKNQFEYAAKKLHELTTKETVTFYDLVNPDSDVNISYAVSQIYDGYVGKRVFDCATLLDIEGCTQHYEGIANSISDIKENTIPQKYPVILEDIYSLHVGNTDPKKAEEIKKELHNAANLYKKARRQRLTAFLDSLQKRNDKKSKEALEKKKDCQDAITHLYGECKWVIAYLNKKYNAGISEALPENSNGITLITRLCAEIDSKNDTIPFSAKKNVIENLAIRLLSIPVEAVKQKNGKEDYFTLGDGSIKKLLDEYENVFEQMKDSYVYAIQTYCIDTFLEVGKKEVIGYCGNYKAGLLDMFNTQQIHFEIFSEEEILAVDDNKKIKDTDKNAYFDPKHCVENIKKIIPEEKKNQLSCLDDNLLTKKEINTFYTDLPELREIACNHISEWAAIDWMDIYEKSDYTKEEIKLYTIALTTLKKDQYIKKYHTPYMWMNKKVFDKDGKYFKDDTAWFYHPIRFLELISV